MGCVLVESGIDGAEGSRKVARRVAGAINSLVNAKKFQEFESARVLH